VRTVGDSWRIHGPLPERKAKSGSVFVVCGGHRDADGGRMGVLGMQLDLSVGDMSLKAGIPIGAKPRIFDL
jgi:hypothetical protein